MSLRIPDVGYISLIPLLEMMALIGQKSRNFKTFILDRASLTQSLNLVGRVNHDLHTRSEGLILILIRSLGYLGSGSDTMLDSDLIMGFQLKTNW